MTKTFKIGSREIGEGRPCFIIAEAGVNHNGDRKLALEMIAAAREAGVDAVKFQSFKADELVTARADKAAYQAVNTGQPGSQLEMLKAFELSWEDHLVYKEASEKAGLIFISTPFESRSLALLVKLKISALKLSSTDTTNLPYIQECASTGIPLIISTGMATMSEVRDAQTVLEKYAAGRYAILHCTTNYPALPEEINLKAMVSMGETLHCPVGYSDHTAGLGASPYAVALGACIIEKHFTMDRDLPGPDHKASLLPGELKQLVSEIRTVEKMLGDGIKKPTASEKRMIPMVRKSIVAAVPIAAGTRLEAQHLAAKRPANGISPARWQETLGRVTTRALEKDEALTEDVLQNGGKHG